MKDDRAIPTRIAAYGCMESILMSLGRKMNPEKLTTLVQILCASLPLLDAKGNSKTVKGRIKMDTLGVKDGKAMVVMVVMLVGAGTSAGAHALVVSFFFSLFFSLFFPPPVSLLVFVFVPVVPFWCPCLSVNPVVRASSFRMLTVLCDIHPQALLPHIDDLCYAMLLTDLKTGLKKTKVLELAGDKTDETIVLGLTLIHTIDHMNGIESVATFASYKKRWVCDGQKVLKELYENM